MNTTFHHNPIVSFLHNINSLSPKAMKDFAAIIQYKEYKRNKELLALNQVATHMFYIQQGLARVYYKRNGKEISDYFAIDGQFIGAVPSVFTGLPSHKAIQLIEDSKVYFFAAEAFEKCCAKHHDLETAARKIAYYAIVQEQERIESMRFNSVAQRYDELERRYPGITNRCPLKYIATYLGTSQVSISRIRGGNQ